MSNKYNSIANEFAAELRGLKRDYPTTTQPRLGAWRVINCWIANERKLNQRFDADRFVAYINERAD